MVVGLSDLGDLFQPESFQDFQQQFAKFGGFCLSHTPVTKGFVVRSCSGVEIIAGRSCQHNPSNSVELSMPTLWNCVSKLW